MGTCASVESSSHLSGGNKCPPPLEVVQPFLFQFGDFDAAESEDARSNADDWFAFLAENESNRNSFQRNFDSAMYPPTKAAVSARVADYCAANPDTLFRYQFARGMRTLPELDELFSACCSAAPSRRGIRAFAGGALPMLMNRIGLHEEPHIMYFLYRLTVEGRRDEFRTSSPSKVREAFDIDENSVSLSTWRRGLLACGVMSLQALEGFAKRLAAIYNQLTVKDVELKLTHRFVFRFLEKDAGLQQVAVCKSDAVAVWRGMLQGKWPLLDDFCVFVEKGFAKKFITVDQWDQLVEFAASVNGELHLVSYNPTVTSWPTLMDEFVAQHHVCSQQQATDATPGNSPATTSLEAK